MQHETNTPLLLAFVLDILSNIQMFTLLAYFSCWGVDYRDSPEFSVTICFKQLKCFWQKALKIIV